MATRQLLPDSHWGNDPTPSLLSQTALHAIRAALFFARQDAERWVSAAEVADGLGAPQNYLGKTLHALARNGILEARRGRNGGYRLATEPRLLTLAALVEGVDELQPPRRCLLWPAQCSERTPCSAHARWSDITRRAWAPLQHTTIAQLLGDNP